MLTQSFCYCNMHWNEIKRLVWLKCLAAQELQLLGFSDQDCTDFFNSSLSAEKKWCKDLKRLQEIKRKKKGGKKSLL